MPGGELEPIGRYGPDLAGVWAEMADIFDRTGAGAVAPHPRRPASVSALRPRRRGGQMMTSLAAAAAGLAGLGIGAFVIHSPQPAQTTAASASAPAGSAPGAASKANGAPAVIGPATSLAPAPAPVAEAAAAQAVRSLAKVPAKAKPAARPRTVVARAARAHKRVVAMAQPASCEHNAKGPGCRRAVMLADRHLRDVYERAVRRGVPRAVLVDYRDRWADLREDDTDDPVRLIENYGALAYDLGREARDGDVGALRRRNRSGFKALADALLPWR